MFDFGINIPENIDALKIKKKPAKINCRF